MASKRSILKKIRHAGAVAPGGWAADLISVEAPAVIELVETAVTHSHEILSKVVEAQAILEDKVVETPSVVAEETRKAPQTKPKKKTTRKVR